MSAVANRVTLIVVGAVTTALSVLLLLVETRVLATDDVSGAVDYRSAVDQLVTWSSGDGLTTPIRIGVVAVSAVIVLLAAWWLVRELSFGYRRPGEQGLDVDADTMAETNVSPAAVRHLTEGAALEAGALSARVSLRPGSTGHVVRCSVVGREGDDLRALPGVVRERIHVAFRDNQLNHDAVTVTVDGVTRRKRAVR